MYPSGIRNVKKFFFLEYQIMKGTKSNVIKKEVSDAETIFSMTRVKT
jgi:hypothetical protein